MSVKKSIQILTLIVLLIASICGPVMAATPAEIEQAIEDGITWLVAQQQGDGSWSSDGEPVACTGFAVIKLTDRAFELGYTPFDSNYAYKNAIENGLNFIFQNAFVEEIGVQPAGNPDTDGDGNGVRFGDEYRTIYSTGICMMAIASTRSPDSVVGSIGSEVDGWTYKQILNDAVDFMAFAQTDIPNTGRGGWRYRGQDPDADNSNTGYAVLGLTYAESLIYGFGCDVPQFVKDELYIYINFIQCDPGDSGYYTDIDGSSGYIYPCEWTNVLKAGNLIVEMTFAGSVNNDPNLQRAFNYLSRTWNNSSQDPGWGNPTYGGTPHYQAMFCVMRGLAYAGIDTIMVDGNERDWYADFADAIVNTQQSGGYWPGDLYGGTTLATEWALLTLERTAPEMCRLELTKTDNVNDGDCAGPGDEITYTINYSYYSNINCPDINDVNIIDYLPEEVEPNNPSDPNYDLVSRTYTWNLGTLHPGDHGYRTLKVNVKCVPPSIEITNKCEIRSEGNIYSTAYEHTSVCSPTLTKVDNITGCVGPGDYITYNICYDANGYDDTGVEIVDDLPDELEFISATGNGQHTAGTVTWDLDTWEPNESNCVTLTVKVLCPQPGSTITNSCTVTGDCMTNPVTASENTSVCGPPTLTKVDNIPDGNCVGPGDNITYTICYNTNGYGDTNVKIIDDLPDELEFVSATYPYQRNGKRITWNIGTMEPDESNCVELVVQVNETADPGGVITNSCQLSGDCISPIYAEEETKVGSPTLTKEAYIPCAGCVHAGDELTYTICYDSNGFSDTNVKIIDTLPPEVDYNAFFSEPPGDYNEVYRTVTWTLDTLEPGESGCVELVVEVNENASGSRITNYCRMAGDRIDIDYYESTSLYQWCPEFEQGVKTCIWWPLEHAWPNMCTPLQVWTYEDPNGPEGETGPNQKIGENFNNGRGVMQTFTVPPESNGFMLTDIVIAANGEGNPDMTFTLHLFDINTAGPTGDGQSWQNTGGYFPEYNAIPAGTDLFSPCCFKFRNCPDKFVSFTFSLYNRVHLEPGHLYAFEIWPSISDSNAAFYWNRNAVDTQYTGGRGYECSGTKDGPGPGEGPQDLSAERTQLTGNSRDMVMGVYGIPFDGNAYACQPRDYKTEVSVNSALSWKAGRWADNIQGHQVWFGTSFSAVNDRLSSANKGRFTEADFNPGTLEFDKMYYWRIDEYNDAFPGTPPDINDDDGSRFWGGPVWRFTTITPKAFNPKPATGSTTEFYINKLELSWTAGGLAADADGHRVYFGTDYNDVLNANTSTAVIYRGQQTATIFDLRTLVPDYTLAAGTYYWRIDEVNEGTAGSPWIGPVWNFSMPTYLVVDAFTYSSNAALQLMWRMHQKKANCAPGLECVPGGTVTLSSGAMRMDYDNSGDSYCGWSEVKMDNGGLGLKMDWTAGGLTNLKSLSIGVDGNIFSGSDLVYDNLYVALEDDSGNIGVVFCNDHYRQMRQFGQVQNWYIDLSDLNNGSPDVVDLTEVNSLYIGLGPRCGIGAGGYFSTGRIDVDNIRLNMPICRTVYSGYGINCAMKGTQEGDFAGIYNAAGNWLPGDCDVDFFDLDYFANVWTDKARNLDFTADMQAPLNDAAHLTVRYEFDETSGSIAYDSSGNARNTNIGNPHPLLWDSNAISGIGCINLEAGLRTWLEVPASAYNPDTNGVSFCFWSAYDMNYQPIESLAAKWASVFTMNSKVPTEANANSKNDDSQLIESQMPTPWPPNYESGPQIRFVDMRGGGPAVINPVPPWGKYSDFGIQWNHYAFTYDDINDIMAVYQNGQLIASVQGDANTTPPIWPAPGSFRIGTRSNKYYDPSQGFMGPDWGFWGGKLDDFRVYNYALTEQEIHYLATKGTGLRTVQLIDPANLANTGASAQQIDFADYALFIKNWLQEDMWP